MGHLLKKAASPEVLNDAWKRLKKDSAVWKTGISKNEMNQNIVAHIVKLSQDLSTGKYHPSPVRRFPLFQGNGKKRIISALTLRDKLAQRAVLTVLNPFGEEIFHQDSYGYRPGRNIDMVYCRIKENINNGLYWIVDADIKEFFDSILLSRMKKQLNRLIPDKDLFELVIKWLEIATPGSGLQAGARGLPMGGVLSPFLCNVYMTEFDRFLSSNSLPFVRFADDFLIFTPSKKAAQAGMIKIQKGLNKIDLKLNKEKTNIVKSGPKVVFLGRKLPPANQRKEDYFVHE